MILRKPHAAHNSALGKIHPSDPFAPVHAREWKCPQVNAWFNFQIEADMEVVSEIAKKFRSQKTSLGSGSTERATASSGYARWLYYNNTYIYIYI